MAHSLTHQEALKSPSRPVSVKDQVHLGWSHFWVLTSILGGMLALVGLVFFAYLVSLR